MKNSFIVYNDSVEYMEKLSLEQLGMLYKAQVQYSLGEEPEITDDVVDIVFSIIKGQMDRDNEKYQQKVERMQRVNANRNRTDNDTKSSRNRHENDTKSEKNRDDTVTESEGNRDGIVSDTVTDTVSDTVKEKDIPKGIQKEKKHKRGKHVLLTDREYEKLKTDYGEQEAEAAVAYLDEYIERRNYKASSHYLSIRKWVFSAMREEAIKAKELEEREKRLSSKASPTWNGEAAAGWS